mmetsp:Transcript_37183/g.98978  ORF Transcript_37183/g.98978 Transcript_37183/m.98978 type:complete len:214 (-) Transcript_37183:147-788(-)
MRTFRILLSTAAVYATTAFQSTRALSSQTVRLLPSLGAVTPTVFKQRSLRLRGGSAVQSMQMNVFAGKSMKDIDGNMVGLDQLAKKVTLVVNVACFCGFTKHYPGLQELQSKFGPENFTVLAFPCNQFGAQEPGTDTEIKAFVSKFGVTFPMLSKSEVNGPNETPLFRALKAAFPGDITWNFGKFLVVDGRVVKRYAPKVPPADIAEDIRANL